MAKRKKSTAGSMSTDDMRKLINSQAGMDVAHNLEEDNPTDVKEWIPTGSTWLDSIVCKGKKGGIPIGKVVELAGLPSTGKSYMACQIAANAQKMGIDVIYFDAESAIDSDFIKAIGVDTNKMIYVQPPSVEFVLETIENLLESNENRMLFIWDSLAFTPAALDVEGDFNPQSSMAVKARILSKAMSKLAVPIAVSQSTLLVLNQLKTNIATGPGAHIAAMTTPYVTPGGKAMNYAYSLRIWLTGRKAKSSFVVDDNGYRIGSEVKVKIEKSRFGTQGRTCNFKIIWGDGVGIMDDESLFEAIKVSSKLSSSGAWYTLSMESGDVKFQPGKWAEKMQDPSFKEEVLKIIDEEVIRKFDKREGDASKFYDAED
tara:strand:- start:24 stop:1139 length:1116 start_codon:yes stop_codon:yes gene_type:complete